MDKTVCNCLLNTIPLSSLKGISAVKIEKLKKIGLYTVRDLLFHFPIRYENRTHVSKIRNLLPDMYATVRGEILSCDVILYNRKVMICKIRDNSGILTIRFFNFNKKMQNDFLIGNWVLIYGKTKRSKYGNIEIIHPKYYLQNDFRFLKLQDILTPIYSTTKGIKQETLYELINQALSLLDAHVVSELLPSKIAQYMMRLPKALYALHRLPSSVRFSDIKNRNHPAQKRLILEELVAYNLNILTLRKKMKCFCIYPLPIHDILKNQFLSSLPFNLTNAQIRVTSEIESDMALSAPMMRLVQGDVGSGKTLIAALAALRVIAHGKQVALMVPTELLAEQHVNDFRNWFVPLGITVDWLTGKQKRKFRILQQNAIFNGEIQMIIGTHAIFQQKIQFHDLSLIIIDEQHRFGVHQRFSLWEKGFQKEYYPHQLIMTATPIPRTLAMTIYANFDISVINELPCNRTPITTTIIPNTRRNDIIDRVRDVCINKRHQVYWVCTSVKKSNALEIQAAETMWKNLKLELPELNIGLIHGNMKISEKREVMRYFKQGILNLLVATTVIEVGINVSNANLIIIENPERLGLVQLHQLRGRVGRGIITSHCVLLYKPPLSRIAKKRLQILRNSSDGFFIAQKDLEIRGSGDIFGGIRQIGNTGFKFVDLSRDKDVFPKAQSIARYIYKYYPNLGAKLIHRWIQLPKVRCYFGV